MLDYPKVREWQSGDVRQAYTARDTMLYALGLGLGADPLDQRQLSHVYEKNLSALPTMAAVLGSPGFWMRERKELGIDAGKLVHGEQALVVHQPLPIAARVVGRTRVTRVVDKGEGKGALLHVEKQLLEDQSETLFATVQSVYFLRGDGGFSAAGRGGDAAAPAPPAMPESAPELTRDLPTRPDQALLYRLCGDMNPLHADPEIAARAGFARPVLQGLATWGMAGYGLVVACGDGVATRLARLSARFAAPVYPGETIRLECWRIAQDETAFRARVLERDLVVLSHGRAHWR